MELEQRASFIRDLRRLRNRDILKILHRKIEQLEQASNVTQVSGVRKLQSAKNIFRIRIGHHRLTVAIDGNRVELIRFRHRRDIYRHFP